MSVFEEVYISYAVNNVILWTVRKRSITSKVTCISFYPCKLFEFDMFSTYIVNHIMIYGFFHTYTHMLLNSSMLSSKSCGLINCLYMSWCEWWSSTHTYWWMKSLYWLSVQHITEFQKIKPDHHYLILFITGLHMITLQ